MVDLKGLPGAETVERGVRDLRRGRLSPAALLVATAVTRLRELGVEIPAGELLPAEPELALYAALGEECDDPYYRYNALRRRLDSFLAALEGRRRPRPRSAPPRRSDRRGPA